MRPGTTTVNFELPCVFLQHRLKPPFAKTRGIADLSSTFVSERGAAKVRSRFKRNRRPRTTALTTSAAPQQQTCRRPKPMLHQRRLRIQGRFGPAQQPCESLFVDVRFCTMKQWSRVRFGLRAVIPTDSLKGGFTPHLGHSSTFASFCSGVKAIGDAGIRLKVQSLEKSPDQVRIIQRVTRLEVCYKVTPMSGGIAIARA